MKTSEISECLNYLDGRGSDQEYRAITRLKESGIDLPSLLSKKYSESKKWGERASCVHHSIKYAKDSEDAYRLGIKALGDKSKVVRYRACMLLAVAQNTDALSHLEKLLGDNSLKEDAVAAIDAIKNKNHNYFVDRDHSGKALLKV